MDIYDVIDDVKNREGLVKFITYLIQDFKANKTEWTNVTVEDYLDGLQAWLDDLEGFYSNQEEVVPNVPSWQVIAQMLLAAAYYE